MTKQQLKNYHHQIRKAEKTCKLAELVVWGRKIIGYKLFVDGGVFGKLRFAGYHWIN